MDNLQAQEIAIKAKALKSCDKMLHKIERKGYIDIKLSCTGIVIRAEKDDAIHSRLKAVRYQLADAINSYEIVQRTPPLISPFRTAPAPIGAAPTPEEILEARRRKQRIYNKRWRDKQKAKKLAGEQNQPDTDK